MKGKQKQKPFPAWYSNRPTKLVITDPWRWSHSCSPWNSSIISSRVTHLRWFSFRSVDLYSKLTCTPSKRGFLPPGRIETSHSTAEFVTRSPSLTTCFGGEWQSFVCPICDCCLSHTPCLYNPPTYSYLLQRFDPSSWVDSG